MIPQKDRIESAIRHIQTSADIDQWAEELAVDALGKQIPIKPIGNHYAYMRCPSCGHRIPSGMGSSSKRRDNWCNYCGQKIDWGTDE